MIGRLPADLRAELRAIRRNLPEASARDLIVQARAAARLISWCRRALAHGHLVTVAAILHRTLRLGPDELESFGIRSDLLAQFPAWESGSVRGFAPPARYLTLEGASAAEPLADIRIQMAPDSGAVPLLLPLLRGLERTIDKDVAIRVMVAPGPAAAALRAFARRALGPGTRVRFALGASANAFARDHAVAGHGPRGEPSLLVPRGFRPERGKEDAPIDARRARAALNVRVRRSLLYWEGGNLLYDGHRCLVGADTIRENAGRLGLARSEVIAILEAEFGATVAVIGEYARSRFDGTRDRLSRSGQASYHIDLDICPLGVVGRRGPVALLSDPDLGLSVLSRALRDDRLRAMHALPVKLGTRLLEEEYRRVAAVRRPRLARYRRQLERLGYTVIGIPELRLEEKQRVVGIGNHDFTYANALPGSRDGVPAVHYLPWGIAVLDRLAERQFRRAGVEPIPLSDDPSIAHAMMELAAGVHCLVGAMPRRRSHS